jgi:hypothetical protein
MLGRTSGQLWALNRTYLFCLIHGINQVGPIHVRRRCISIVDYRLQGSSHPRRRVRSPKHAPTDPCLVVRRRTRLLAENRRQDTMALVCDSSSFAFPRSQKKLLTAYPILDDRASLVKEANPTSIDQPLQDLGVLFPGSFPVELSAL